LGLVCLAAVLAGRASLSGAAWQSADAKSTTIGMTAESTAAKDARVEAAYRKGDYETLLQLLRELASQQSAFAERYRKAALQGSATAQGILGVISEEGIGISRDPVEAARWFRKAAEQGDPAGQKYLGDMYRRGLGVPKDFSEAMKWYRKAAEQGDGPAQGMLGIIYGNGLGPIGGVQPDVIQAYMWLTLAASNLAGTERDATIQARDRLLAGMSKAEVGKAQQLAREWKPPTDPAVGEVKMTVAADEKALGAGNSPQAPATATPGTTPIIPSFPGWKWDSGKSLEVHTPPGTSSPRIPGYEWLEIKSLGFSLLRPTGWFYKEVDKNGTINAFMTRENIDDKGSFQTGLTIHGIPNVQDPIAAARGYVIRLKSKTEALSEPGETKAAGRTFVRFMYRFKDKPIQMALQVIGDPQTKRVVIMSFEAPSDSWADAWKQGEPIMGLIRFDSP
jgi:Sel1 repeat